MTETRRESPSRPELPAVDFDWSPEKWRQEGQRLLEVAIKASTGWQDRRPTPEKDADLLGQFREDFPETPIPVADLAERIEDVLIPGSGYNGHPRWMAYITGSAAPITVVGDLVASALNQNTAMWRLAPGATRIEQQAVRWIGEMLGMPASTDGIFVSGGQLANTVAQAVFRDAKAPWDTRRYGLRGPDGNAPRLRIYASQESHYCHQQAAEFLGLGQESVRLVPVDELYKMRLDDLKTAIAEDRGRGHLPIAIVGTAGTVGTGAVDPLDQLQSIAREEDLWLHVDGAYGAFAHLAEGHPKAMEAIAEADSVACDPHKWLYSAIDAGVVLVRQPGLLNQSFAFHAAYLATDASEEQIDLLERSPENTRPFRALKVWLALQHYGKSGYRSMIQRNLQLAAYMEQLVESTQGLTLAAPRELSIVCWRVEPPGLTDKAKLEQLQTDVIDQLEARGIAMVSNAQLHDGRTAIRACIVNFRTAADDVEAVVQATATIGEELASSLAGA